MSTLSLFRTSDPDRAHYFGIDYRFVRQYMQNFRTYPTPTPQWEILPITRQRIRSWTASTYPHTQKHTQKDRKHTQNTHTRTTHTHKTHTKHTQNTHKLSQKRIAAVCIKQKKREGSVGIFDVLFMKNTHFPIQRTLSVCCIFSCKFAKKTEEILAHFLVRTKSKKIQNSVQTDFFWTCFFFS